MPTTRRTIRQVLTVSALAVAGAVPLTASAATANCDNKIDGTKTISAWFHSGTGAERDTLQKQVDAFNASQSQVKVDLKLLPEGTYNDQVKAAAAAGNLPDVLDFDGPNVYNYAWSGNVLSIDGCVPAALKADLLPSIAKQGTYAGKFYGVGTFDSGLGLYASKKALKKAKVRLPTLAKPWTAAEFTAGLKKLKAAGYKTPLDMKIEYGVGEWYTYGFSPIIQSAGGDLINRTDYTSAKGVLNSPASVKALTTMQGWFNDKLVDLSKKTNTNFQTGKTAISWVGHWMFNDYKKALKGDLAVLPLPNFGKGSKTGQGSWNWGITKATADPDASWKFIEYLMQPEQIVAITDANGAVPATRSSIALSKNFKPGGPLEIYAKQLSSISVPRPQTPAYPAITTAFAKAIQDISKGKNVKQALDAAVSTIDKDIKSNDGYPVQG